MSFGCLREAKERYLPRQEFTIVKLVSSGIFFNQRRGAGSTKEIFHNKRLLAIIEGVLLHWGCLRRFSFIGKSLFD